MQHIYSGAQVRAAEQAYARSAPLSDLMERASAGLAAAVREELGDGRRVLVVTGPGSNGGDALFAGAALAADVDVMAWRTSEKVHDEAWAAFTAAGGTEVSGDVDTLLDGVDLLVDGVYGLGARAGLPEDVAALAAACRERRTPVVACDLPSGVEADSGNATEPSFWATRTVTFGSYKPCHVLGSARERCGRVTLVDIGLELSDPPLVVWERADVAAAWPYPDASSDKYSRGVVGIDTGSPGYPGAGILTTFGAVHAGAGMVRFCGPEEVGRALTLELPNVVHGEGRVQAWLVGSGWGERPDGKERLQELLGTGLPVVVDANAIAYVPEQLGRPDVLLTPHAGELAKLLVMERSDVEADPVGAVRKAAGTYGVTVLLKGSTQYVAGPRSTQVQVAVTGPAWTAQAGSGDTLAGVCATLLAAGLAAPDAAVCAASVQALTASARPGPYPPQDTARHFPATIAALEAEARPA